MGPGVTCYSNDNVFGVILLRNDTVVAAGHRNAEVCEDETLLRVERYHAVIDLKQRGQRVPRPLVSRSLSRVASMTLIEIKGKISNECCSTTFNTLEPLNGIKTSVEAKPRQEFRPI